MAKGFSIFEIPVEVLIAIVTVALILTLFPQLISGIIGSANTGFNSITEGITRMFGG